MGINPQEEFTTSRERTTRVLTAKELLDMNRDAVFLETNIPKLLEENPSLVVEMTQTRGGQPLELKIISNGVMLFYDNLEAVQRLKLQSQKPKDTIH